MKKLFLLLPIAGLVAYFSLTSYTAGYPANYTGSRGGPAGCGSSRTCHGNVSTGVSVLFELADSATGTVVSDYKPRGAYTLKLILLNTTTATLPKYGFQLSTAAGGFQAGAFVPVSLPVNTTVTTYGSTSLTVWEQAAKLAATSGGGGFGSTYQTSIRWKAPDTGTGPITFFGAGCLVNNNGAADTIDDKWNVAQRIYSELTPEGVGEQHLATAAQLQLYPNPANGVINVTGLHTTGLIHIAVMDLNGRIVLMKATDNSNGNVQLDVVSLQSGLYQVVATTFAMQQTATFLRQ